MTIRFDYSYTGIKEHEISYRLEQLMLADEILGELTGPGSDFLGWLDYPSQYDRDEFDRIKEAA
ncbi:MAG: glucose-6-phosphate isomerase, partial [Eubacteriaceae bacterium]|nr:glucose-6-phosphate isomerase [Eubacteriaceae bacterium]